MTEHQVVCVCHQFEDSVSFMCPSTPHLLSNMACAVNCGSQKQGHADAAFNWCGKETPLVGFGMNSSMGTHFNPVSISIVNSDSKIGIKSSYEATCSGLYTLYNSASLCDSAECGFCSQMHAQIGGPAGALWRNQLASDDTASLHYQLDNPSSDHCASYHSVAKELFGPECNVGRCRQHMSGKHLRVYIFETFLKHFLKRSDSGISLQPLHGRKSHAASTLRVWIIGPSFTSLLIIYWRILRLH